MEPDVEPQSPPKPSPQAARQGWKWDMGHLALSVLAGILGLTSLLLWIQVGNARREARTNVASVEGRAQRVLDGERKTSHSTLSEASADAARNQALAFAAAIQPVMAFRGQIPEVTDRSVQSATENLAREGNYSFVAVTDATGKVVSSSDLTIIGQDFTGNLEPGVAKVEGQNQAVARIGAEGAPLGHLVIRIRSGT